MIELIIYYLGAPSPTRRAQQKKGRLAAGRGPGRARRATADARTLRCESNRFLYPKWVRAPPRGPRRGLIGLTDCDGLMASERLD